MMRKDISAKFLALVLSCAMPAGMCLPAAVPVYAAEESRGVEAEVLEADDTAEVTGAVDEAQTSDAQATDTESGPEEILENEDVDVPMEGTYTEKEENQEVEENVTEEDSVQEEQAAAVEAGSYALMNIPYDDFYKAEISNSVPVDAFTSATLNKTRTDSLAGGSYHVDSNGTDITGITYPVKIGEGVDFSDSTKYKEVKDADYLEITVTNRGTTSTKSYNGSETLFESPSYSYYVLEEEPKYYKTVTVGSDGKLVFGKAEGTRTVVPSTNAKAVLETESSYGDYGLTVVSGNSTGNPEFLNDVTTVYGVVINTDGAETSGYGLRHMENIWQKTKLAWCTGFTKDVHNCPTSQEHYASMMGQNITGVTYYTDKGIYEILLAEAVHVPVKFEYTLEVEDAPLGSGSTNVNLNGLPADYGPAYNVAGLEGAGVAEGKLSYTKERAKKGSYTLVITDQGGKYAPISAAFELYVDAPVTYSSADKKLMVKSGGKETDFAEYIGNIKSAEINGQSYAAEGRGAVKVIDDDGKLNVDAGPIKAEGVYTIILRATGYTEVEFHYSPNMKLEGVEKAIESAKKLSKSSYTATSWKALETALEGAENALKSAASQTELDRAQAQLDRAVRALVKVRPKTGSTVRAGTVKYQVKSSSAVTVKAPSSKSLSKVSIPAAVTINGYRYNVTAIGNKAFAGCTELKTVSIGKNVASIGTNAFYNCKAVTKVTITSTALTKIGNAAFSGCTAMTSFTAQSAKLTSIGSKAFAGDKKLKSITLKTAELKKAKVGANAFRNIKASCTFKVPAEQVKAYKKIFQAKGAGKKIKVKK